ncbi:hypothetical protein [Lacrimispora sp. 210928-DFI.3.58]|uniref:hypothetical protein n=1 Tax=Lacrimispora sp. 210928-DFI.3.58 TaxID=2883214 RepID=UPI001D08BD02|nr:hypothetical protein [Lacrimispora sp. 210928-DFI.3.58]MCB7320782.1 hypothetical protein [Lacrimispora sp. 210928-DFI.3.58]
MAYEPYVTPQYYLETYKGSAVPEEELEQHLRVASRHIDSLTYNRIVGRGFSNLTPFQQEVIQEVVCQQADFEHENADMIDTVLSGYSLNGASVQFGSSWNVYTDKGIAMKKDVYALLAQTGLCCRLAR